MWLPGCCISDEGKAQLREALRRAGLRELSFRFEFEGSKVVFDIVSRDGCLAQYAAARGKTARSIKSAASSSWQWPVRTSGDRVIERTEK